MAEAAVGSPVGRYFCHKCTQEISPILPDFVCPRCNSGFIEELEQGTVNSPSEYVDEDLIQGQPNFELFGFLNSLGQLPPNEHGGSNFRANREHLPSQVPPSASSPGNRTIQGQIYPTRVSIRRHTPGERGPTPLEGLLHQILANLTEGGGFGVGNATIPILFNLHSNPGDYVWGRAGLDAIITQLLNQLDCTGPPPLSKEKISQIPTVEITQDQVEKTLQCTVCMEDYEAGERVRRLPCQHHFHTDCIVPWLELHGTCPICRKTLNEEALDGYPAQERPNDVSFGTGRNSSSSSSAPPSSSVYEFNEEYD